jgi:hypothetical protein
MVWYALYKGVRTVRYCTVPKHLSISKLYILEKSGNPIQLTGT